MTERLKEQVSAFVDGALEEQEHDLLLRRLTSEDDLRQTLHHFHLIGDVMRASPDSHMDVHEAVVSGDFAGRIAAAVAAENAPAAQPVGMARSLRPLGMAAASALVALGAIFGVQQLQQDEPQALVQAPVEAPAAEAVLAETVPATTEQTFSTVPPVPVSNPGQLRGTDLARYVVHHNRYTRTPSRPGIVTYGVVGLKTQAEREHSRGDDQARADQSGPSDEAER